MFSVFLLVLVLWKSHGLVGALNEEGHALISFKNAIVEDPEGSLSNWNSSDESPCSWNGVTCKDQRVVSVSIPRKRLTGFLSPSLGSLSELRHVNLRNNKLSGSLPVELFGALGLQSLVLYGNSLSGSVPDEIGRLRYLQILDLSENLFNGSLPSLIVQCRRLRALDLSENNFTGSLPDGIGANLGSLAKLDLSNNSFSGLIPSDMGNLSSLQGTVDLSHNMFSGLIPASLGNLPEKVYIDLTYNDLRGPIPQSGALMNRGPTAFMGNPGLCGPPLKDPCPPGSDSAGAGAGAPLSNPLRPSNDTEGRKRGGLSKGVVAAIVVSDVVGICLVGLLVSFCYSRIWGCGRKDEDGYGLKKGKKGRRDCLCLRKVESDTVSENVEQCDLVALDTQVAFDLDELLKASAFVLGKSGIGIVYKVVLDDGIALAVRRLGEGGSQRFKEFQTEVEAIGKLRNPNIATLRAYYWSVDEKLLIYDYVPNGNLATAIHGKAGMVSFTPMSWSTRLKIMKGISKGVAYLHEFSPKKYVHGDLKPSNILLGLNMEPQISDFGLGRLANIAGGSPTLQSNRIASENPHERLQKSAPSEVSTFSPPINLGSYYQAPEALKMVKPSQKWDIYSFGVILLELITGRMPMDLVQWIQLCIEEKKPLSEVLDPFLGEEADKEDEMVSVIKIAMACVNSSPERRPTMRHVVDVLERMAETTMP